VRAHVPIPNQNRIVVTVAGFLRNGAVPSLRPNRGDREDRSDHRCTAPTARSTKKGSRIHYGKGKPGHVTSNSWLTLKRLLDRLLHHGVQRLCLLGMLMLRVSATDAHELITTKITWGREISRVFSRRCISCHHKGGSAFDLSAYERARPWAEAIKQEVLERRMPPWGAVKGFGDFRDDDGLSENEIALISSWVEGGAPRGDLNLLPRQIEVKAEPSVPPKIEKILLASGSLTLKRTVKIAGVRPETVPEGASLRVIAEHPNGAMEPLIWLYSYASRFRRVYYFKAPMRLGAGTRIRFYPAAGSVSLLLL
jgi:hypothetical protein